MSIYVIGDIHGCFDTFMALLKKLPDDAKICLAGDLIDRGPKSRQVVQYVIDNDIDCVQGNHEDMMIVQPDYWALNGGMETLESYSDPVENMLPNSGHVHKLLNVPLFEEHKLWMDKLPVYIEYPDVKNEDGRHLVVSHSILHNVWRHRNTPERALEFRRTATWSRSFFKIKDNPEIYNVFGHTPQEYEAKIRKIYANVDTGCCFKDIPSRLEKCSYGILTALKFPEMELITQKNIDKY